MNIIFLLLLLLTSENPGHGVGSFSHQADVGQPKLKGSSVYYKDKDSYILTGGGYNIWFNRDEFHYLYNEIEGDFSLRADFEFVGNGSDAHRKIGWMARESLDADAAHVSAVVHGDGLTVMQWRGKKGDQMRDPQDEIFSAQKFVRTIQLERRGNIFTMRVLSPQGVLETVGSHEASMGKKVLAGLFICSHDSNSVVKANISKVVIDRSTP